MIPIYHCRNCKTNFMLPLEISNGLDITLFVCPNCKSRNWGKVAI